MALIDEARSNRLAGELRTPNGDVGYRRLLEPPNHARVELPLDARPCAGHRLKRPGVDDLIGDPPELGEVPAD